MPHKFDPARIAELDRKDRFLWQSPRVLLDLADVRPGTVVLDVGCGVGFFALPAARRVAPHGLVYAADVEPKMLRELRRRAQGMRLPTVRPVRSTEGAIPIGDAVADVAWSVNAFHEFDEPVAVLREIRRILRPAGRAFLVDWRRVETPMGPPREVRASAGRIQEALRAAGFVRIARHAVYPYHNVIEGSRPREGKR